MGVILAIDKVELFAQMPVTIDGKHRLELGIFSVVKKHSSKHWVLDALANISGLGGKHMVPRQNLSFL